MHFTAIPLPSPFAPTLLWGVTLNILSDFVDLGHSPRQIQKVTPLEYPLPAFDLWPINYIMRWICRPDPLRKPATCRPSSTWESYFRTLHWVGSISLAARFVIVWLVARFFNSHRFNPSRIFARLTSRKLPA
ncbi:hypothetical protein DSO57_1014210 [Entomophthora muscae]|nr:hypothetical protein DSO57_1014210 [Entomophthora muscae]